MPYRIEDGKGSRFRASIFEHKVRTFAVESSLMNHLLLEPLEGLLAPRIGVFEFFVVTSVAGSGSSLIYMVNNDPENFILIDRIYTNAIVSSTTLPNTSTYISLIMGSSLTPGTGNTIILANLNEAIINIQPEVTILNKATTSGGAESMRRYIQLDRTYFQEILPQKEDGIILGTGNSVELFLNTLSSTTINVSMRFGVANPDDMEFS